jgi:hypothetical protein
MKNYRCYFNRKNEYPAVWSIDEGSQASEINVQWIKLENVEEVFSFYEVIPDDERHDRPCAWFSVTGTAIFENGGVVIVGCRF